jgi:hypothetical protein
MNKVQRIAVEKNIEYKKKVRENSKVDLAGVHDLKLLDNL